MNARRPLSVGETLNEVFALYGQYYGVLLPVAFWLFLVVSILEGIAGSNTGLLGLVAILSFATGILYQGIVVSLVRDVRAGGEGAVAPTAGQLFSAVGPVLPTLLATSVLYGLALIVGLALFIVPGLILLTIWAVIAPAIVIEKKGIGDSFRRSQELVRDHGWTVFGAVVAAAILTAVTTLILVEIGDAIAGGPLLRIVFGALASTLAAPVGGLVAAVLYYRLVAIKGDGNPMMPPKLSPDA
jgi:hypothetical protein